MNFDISDAKIFSRVPTHLPLIGDIVISEAVVISQLVMLIITGLCIFLIHDLKMEYIGKRQALAELIVEGTENLVRNNMGGGEFDYLIPSVGTLFSTNAISNLVSLVGLESPTANLSVEAAWTVAVFTMITLNKVKAGGLFGYPKGFTTPIPMMTPSNIPSEIATPISMAYRHFGNVLSDVVTNGLICAALSVAPAAPFRLIPGTVGDFLSHIPTLAIGPPAITSFYLDWFSNIMQAFISIILIIIYIANASEG